MAGISTGVPLSNFTSYDAIREHLENLHAPVKPQNEFPQPMSQGDDYTTEDLLASLLQPVGGATGAGESTTQLNPIQQVHADIFQSLGNIVGQFLGGGSTSGTNDSAGGGNASSLNSYFQQDALDTVNDAPTTLS